MARLYELLDVEPEVWGVMKTIINGLRGRDMESILREDDFNNVLRRQGSIRALDELIHEIETTVRRVVELEDENE